MLIRRLESKTHLWLDPDSELRINSIVLQVLSTGSMKIALDPPFKKGGKRPVPLLQGAIESIVAGDLIQFRFMERNPARKRGK